MSLEIEQAILGSLIFKSELLEKCANVTPAHFQELTHAIIFEKILELSENGHAIDFFILLDGLSETEVTAEYLNSLYEDGRVDPNLFDRYLALFVDSYNKRLITEQLNDASNAREVDQAIEMAQKAIDSIAVSDHETVFDLNSLLRTGINRIEERFENPGHITGLETGFHTIDNATAGLQEGDYVVLAARPSMGKTAYSMTMVAHALSMNKHVVFFSLEMTANQLTDRLLSTVGSIDANHIKTGNLVDEDWEKLAVAANKLKDKKLFIDERNSISPQYMDGVLRKREREHGKIDIILVDYLQLMRLKNHRDGRVNEVTAISGYLKGLAKKYKCPVVALSQLSRSCESRPDKRPVPSDLRESGAIEQDADIILFLYRDEYYNPETERKGVAEVIMSKNRNGEVGTHYANFVGRYTRFENMKEG